MAIVEHKNHSNINYALLRKKARVELYVIFFSFYVMLTLAAMPKHDSISKSGDRGVRNIDTRFLTIKPIHPIHDFRVRIS